MRKLLTNHRFLYALGSFILLLILVPVVIVFAATVPGLQPLDWSAPLTPPLVRVS